jgi:hypothetical protein
MSLSLLSTPKHALPHDDNIRNQSSIHTELAQAHRSNRTALVLDPSGAVEIFMRYAGVRLVNAEQLFAQVTLPSANSITTADGTQQGAASDAQSSQKTRASALQELRAAAAECMLHGLTLVLRIGTTPVDFRSVVCSRLSYFCSCSVYV